MEHGTWNIWNMEHEEIKKDGERKEKIEERNASVSHASNGINSYSSHTTIKKMRGFFIPRELFRGFGDDNH